MVLHEVYTPTAHKQYSTEEAPRNLGSGSSLCVRPGTSFIARGTPGRKRVRQYQKVMDKTEILHALETAVLERNEDKIFPMNDTFGFTHTDLGVRNL